MSNVWLFSEDYGKLYVFENQPMDFDGLQPVLDKQILQEKGRNLSRIRKTFWCNNTDIDINQYYYFCDICIYKRCSGEFLAGGIACG